MKVITNVCTLTVNQTHPECDDCNNNNSEYLVTLKGDNGVEFNIKKIKQSKLERKYLCNSCLNKYKQMKKRYGDSTVLPKDFYGIDYKKIV